MDGDSAQTTVAGPRKRPTLKTVAEATGFAVTTVSRALANDERIAEATRARVKAVANELGYVPDRAAQRLRTGRTKVISLLVNPKHEFLGFVDVLLNGLSEACNNTGYHINITPDYLGADRLSTIENIMRNRLADGVICSRTECFDPRVRLMLENDFPFVTHGRTEFSTPHAYVDFDNEAFARHAVRHLVKNGRQRICMIPPDARFTFAQHLRYGFLSEARAAGVEFILPDDITLDDDAETLANWITAGLASDTPADGYVCVGEVAALATIAALQDSNKQIGVDADIFAKRASPIFSLMRPKIDGVFEDLHATGRALGEMLLEKIDGKEAAQLQHIISPKVSVRS